MLDKKIKSGDRRVVKKELKDEFEKITVNYREHGWTGPTSKADPIDLVIREMKKTVMTLPR